MHPTTRCVAIVEDDHASRASLARIVRAGGYDAVMYASAEEFLRTPASSDALCLLVDIQLGGMSGLELHRRLVDGGDRVPVVIITAFHDERARRTAEALGCIAYLEKPCTGYDVLAILRRLSADSAQS